MEVKYIWWSEKWDDNIPENITSIEWFVKILSISVTQVTLNRVGNVIKGRKEAGKSAL